MRIRIARLNSRGDTILEVLIAVAILSLILTSSFALANRSSLANRQAAERGEASKTAQAEIEELKYYLSSPGVSVPANNSYFCIDTSNPTSPTVAQVNNISAATIDTAYNSIRTECRKGTDQRYATFIYRGPAGSEANTYTTYVRWDSVSGRSTDKISISNKVYPNQVLEIDGVGNNGAVDIDGPPPVVNITADATSINTGQSTTIRWNVLRNPTSCTASGDWSGARTIPTGTQSTGTLTSARNYTYSLTCVNQGGTTTNSVVVQAIAPLLRPSISPTSWNAPSWHLYNTGGTRQTRTFTITGQAGSASVQLTDATITGTHANSFQITSNGCANRLLVAGQSCTVTVQFYPPSGGANNRQNNAGVKSAVLNVNNSSGISPTVTAALTGRAISDRMLAGDVLNPGQYLKSYNTSCYNNADACGHLFIMQGDGNLVLYASGGGPVWWTGTSGSIYAVMQGDGHLVLYRTTGGYVWASHNNIGGAYQAGDWLWVNEWYGPTLNLMRSNGNPYYNFTPYGAFW